MNDTRQQVCELTDCLAGNPYPGRGLVFGVTPGGKEAVSVYFIMGRSQNSRNRIFAPTEDGIRTEAYDENLVEDPSLIIYRAVRTLCLEESGGTGGEDTPDQDAARRLTIVTNGDQTDTVYDGLLAGKSFEEALAGRTFEPDAPNYTPRISGLMEIGPGGKGLEYQISILRTESGDPSREDRGFWTYSPAVPGIGHFISTYVTDGSPLPGFEGEPKAVRIPENVEDWAADIWQALDKANRISLYVRAEELQSGSVWECIINAHDDE